MEDNKKLPKTPQIFFCKKCIYECTHNGDWNKHVRTSKHLKDNNDKIALVLANLKNTTDNLAAAKIKETVESANNALAEISAIMTKINKREGTLGLLINDKELYTNLNKTAFDLDVILKDLNKFPAKYIPIPFTKGQRKKALDASNKATTP